jgi:hypothetical protein
MSIANLTKFDPAKNTFSFDSTLQSGILNSMNQSQDPINSTFIPFPEINPFPEIGVPPPFGGGGGDGNPYREQDNPVTGEINMDNIRSFFGFNQAAEGEEGEEGEDGFSFDGIMNAFRTFSPVNFAIRNIVSPVVDKINETYEAYRERQRQASIAEGATSAATNANRTAQQSQHDKLADAFNDRTGGGNHGSTGTSGGPSAGPGANATGNGNGLA